MGGYGYTGTTVGVVMRDFNKMAAYREKSSEFWNF